MSDEITAEYSAYRAGQREVWRVVLSGASIGLVLGLLAIWLVS